MATFAGAGLGSTLVPGVVWARVQDSGTPRVTLAMVNEALKLSGIEIGEEEKTTSSKPRIATWRATKTFASCTSRRMCHRRSTSARSCRACR